MIYVTSSIISFAARISLTPRKPEAYIPARHDSTQTVIANTPIVTHAEQACENVALLSSLYGCARILDDLLVGGYSMRGKYIIPFYGFYLGLLEYSQVTNAHRMACARHQADPSLENYNATWIAFDKRWLAMDRVLVGLWCTVGFLAALIILVALGISVLR